MNNNNKERSKKRANRRSLDPFQDTPDSHPDSDTDDGGVAIGNNSGTAVDRSSLSTPNAPVRQRARRSHEEKENNDNSHNNDDDEISALGSAFQELSSIRGQPEESDNEDNIQQQEVLPPPDLNAELVVNPDIRPEDIIAIDGTGYQLSIILDVDFPGHNRGTPILVRKVLNTHGLHQEISGSITWVPVTEWPWHLQMPALFTPQGAQVVELIAERQNGPPQLFEHPTLLPLDNRYTQDQGDMKTISINENGRRTIICVTPVTGMVPLVLGCGHGHTTQPDPDNPDATPSARPPTRPEILIEDHVPGDGPPRVVEGYQHLIKSQFWVPRRYWPKKFSHNNKTICSTKARVLAARALYVSGQPPAPNALGPGYED